MANKAVTEANRKTVDEAETGIDAKTAEEVRVQTRRRGMRWTRFHFTFTQLLLLLV